VWAAITVPDNLHDENKQYLVGVSKFGSLRFLPEKNSQIEKKTRNRTGTGPNRTVPVRFFIQKTGQIYRLILGLFWAF
jgi:hypothetical protein